MGIFFEEKIQITEFFTSKTAPQSSETKGLLKKSDLLKTFYIFFSKRLDG